MSVSTRDSGSPSNLPAPSHWQVVNFWTKARQVSLTGKADEGLLSVYLDRGVIPYSEGGSVVHKPSETLDGYQLVEPGNFVLNNQQAWRGSVGVSKHRGIVSPAYLVFEVSPELDPSFANYQFREQRFVDEMMLSSQGVGDIQRQMKWPLLRTAKVFIPPLDEQRAIVRHLDRATARIDALITKKTRFIELLREKRQALITHAVTKGLDASVPMKNSGVEWLGNVPAHWDVVRGIAVLVECRAKNDPLFSENYLSLMANIGIIPYDEKGDVGNKKPEDLRKCKLVEPGDFVINSMNYAIGSYGVSRYSGICSSVYVVMKHKPNLANPRFIDLILSNPSYQNYAQSFGTGILDHRRAIGWDEIKAIPVPLPSLDEQGAIADWALRLRDRVDTLIAKTRRSIELLREHRTALITAAVTGKINLRNAA
jgi:type I restriction enzyme S subunit